MLLAEKKHRRDSSVQLCGLNIIMYTRPSQQYTLSLSLALSLCPSGGARASRLPSHHRNERRLPSPRRHPLPRSSPPAQLAVAHLGPARSESSRDPARRPLIDGSRYQQSCCRRPNESRARPAESLPRYDCWGCLLARTEARQLAETFRRCRMVLAGDDEGFQYLPDMEDLEAVLDLLR